MRRALLVALGVCLLGALAYGVQLLLELRAATAPPTPETYVQTTWTLYRLAPGHRTHVGEQGIECVACHAKSEKGRFDEPESSVCAKCHEQHTTIQHAKDAVPTSGQRTRAEMGSDCSSCHGFGPDPEHKATDCLACHAQPKGEHAAVVTHAEQACSTCHDVHENSVTGIDCVACHKVKTEHGGHRAGSPAQCLDCHDAHGPASAARARCADCHQSADSKVRVNSKAAAHGHSCVGCHQPHAFAASDVASCTSCHRDQHVLAGKGHSTCTACHAPHEARDSVARADTCTRCHADVALHHTAKIEATATCTTCHPAHPERGASSPLACSGCHADVRATELGAHAEGVACTGCHEPHDFTGVMTDRASCRGCHQQRMTQLASHAGHARCESCHQALPHGGMGKEVACASCHAEGARAHEGHRTCTNCHDAHTGAQSAKACASCHQQEVASLSPKHGPCASCHEAHAATPTSQIAQCTGCHASEKLPALHRVPEHRARCQSCHEAHPERPPALAATCRSCHDEMADHQPEATQCSGCHPFERPPSARRTP